MESCLKHGRSFRCRLEFVLNQLRNGGKLTHGQSGRVTDIVCTCGKTDDSTQARQDRNVINREFSEAYTRVLQVLKTGNSSGKESLFSGYYAKALLGLFEALESVNWEGLKRIVVVLTKVISSDFDNAFPVRPVTKQTVILSLSLPSDCIGNFIGKNGRGLGAIREKSGCSIKMESHHSGTDIVIRIEGRSSGSSIDTASTLLRERAKDIREKRRIQNQRVKEFTERRNKKRMASLLARERNTDRSTGTFQDIKNLNRAEYNRQKSGTHKLRNAGLKVKGHRVLAEGSRCLNCLGDFDPSEMRRGACKFHPGFIVGDQWSCCEKVSADQHPSYKEHKKTGCSSSVHNWRPTQKRQGKSSLNCAKEPKCSLLQDGTELLRDFKLS